MAERRKKKNARVKDNRAQYYDYALLFFVVFLVMFGLVMLFSTSSYVAQDKFGDSAYYVKRQGLFAVAGIAAMLGVSRVNYRAWQKTAPLLYLGALAVNAAVYLIGETISGSTRWLTIGGVSFQPSELAKVGVIIYTAYRIAATPRKLYDFKEVAKIFAWDLVLAVPVLYANLSTGIIIMGIAFVMLFVASPQFKEFFGIILFGAALAAAFLVVAGYRMERVRIWLNPENYEKGYQTLQGLYAIGSGGLFGKGLGQSLQKLGFLPEPENDMIFSIICEELGLFGAICVILLFLLLLWRLLIISNNAVDLFGSMVTIGIMAHLALQVVLNIAVVTNSIPNTGVTLPFISYGGTSVLVLLGEMGIALSISRGIRLEVLEPKQETQEEAHG